MKKNISINLFGTLYAIDEDAYNLLDRYLDSMKSYFSRKEGGKEIADDIEHRVAELLWQKKEAGAETVDIDTIKEVIGKIGDPEQIDGGDVAIESAEEVTESTNKSDEPLDSHPFADGGSGSRSSNEKPEFAENASYDKSDTVFDRMKSNMKGRRLYRDIRNKVIGGVCSGMANYWGGDPTIWRLGTVIAAFALWNIDIWWLPGVFNWIIPLGYCLLWLILPVVRTAEDNLRMRGEEVNPQNLNQEILNESDKQAQQQQNYYQYSHSDNDGCLKIAGIGCIGMIILGVLAIITPIIFLSTAMSGLSGIIGGPFGGGGGNLLNGVLSLTQGMLWTLLFCIAMVLLIPLFFLVRSLSGSKKAMSTTAIIVLILVWLLSLIGGIYLFTNKVKDAMSNITPIIQFDDSLAIDEDTLYAEPDTVSVDTMCAYDPMEPDEAVEPDEPDAPVNMTVSPSKVSVTTPDAQVSVGPSGVKINKLRSIKRRRQARHSANNQ